jgi:hypothetical protein
VHLFDPETLGGRSSDRFSTAHFGIPLDDTPLTRVLR